MQYSTDFQSYTQEVDEASSSVSPAEQTSTTFIMSHVTNPSHQEVIGPNINMSTMNSNETSQPNQYHHSTHSPTSSYSTQGQEIVLMNDEFSFFYRPCNDFQIYKITYKEISFDELVFRLSNHIHIQSNNLHVF